jgi:hypothetical protein
MRGVTVAALALSLGLTAAAVSAAPRDPLLRPFADPMQRFAILLPAGWPVQETHLGAYSIEAVAPDHHATVSVLVAINAPSVPTSAEFARQQFGALSQEAGFSLLKQGPIQVAGRRGFYRYFTTLLSPGGLYTLQVYLVTPRWNYVLAGSTTNQPGYVQEYFQTILRVVQSFEPSA